MSTFLQEPRFALRQLRRNPGFSLAAVITLAIGIGATTAMFSVVNGVLLDPLPFEESDELLLVRHHNRPAAVERDAMSIRTYRELAGSVGSFRSFAGLAPFDYSVTVGMSDGPERLAAQFASGTLLDVLGVRPGRGRWFLPEEDVVGGAPVAVLGHALWMERFGGDPRLIGSSVVVDGRATTIVGVMPAGFEPLLADVDMWLPLEQSPFAERFAVRWIAAVGRLSNGSTRERAEAEVGAVMARLAQEFPDTNTGLEADLLPIREEVVGSVRGALLALLAGVGIVLLIACANVASLLLTRSLGRDGEMAVRSALGARLPQLGRLLATEGMALVGVGGALGLLFAIWVVGGIRAMSGLDLPRIESVAIDGRVLAVLLFLIGVTGVASALAPLLHVRGVDLRAILGSGARATGSAGARRLQGGLIVSQVALATILLVASGLLARSFWSLLRTDPGFMAQGVLTLQVGIPPAASPTPEERLASVDRILDRVEAIPGVEAAGATTRLPLLGGSLTTSLEVEAHPAPVGAHPEAELRRITPGYFPAMGMRLAGGRDLTSEEVSAEAPVLLVNETAASALWPEGDPVGKRVRFSSSDPGPGDPWYTVIGVVTDVRQFGLSQAPRPEVYFSFADSPPTNPMLAIRTSVPPSSLVPSVRAAVREIVPEATLWEVATMEERIAGSLARRTAGLWIVSGFGLLALGLAVIGVYGVVSHSVERRRREIGIRIALGASRHHVALAVVGAASLQVGLGLAVGLGTVTAGADTLSGFLYGVGPRDPAILSIVAAILITVGALAILVPVRRAARVDPMLALRPE